MSVKIAAAQIRSTSTIQGNLDKLNQYASYASKENAKIFVTPELYLPGYDNTSRYIKDNSITIPSNDTYSYSAQKANNYLDEIALIAINNNIDIVCGFSEYNPINNKYYNSLLWLNSKGILLCIYRKTHLWGKFEKKTFDRYELDDNNDNYKIIECYGMKFGLLICFDIEFPEASRIYAIKGAQCIIIPTALMGFHNKTTDIFPICRATENSLYIVNVNYPQPKFCGCSSISSPCGYKIAQSGNQEEQLLYATLDYNNARNVKQRKRNPYLIDRRPELYKDILKSKL